MDFEPEPVFARVRVPTLLIYGEDDDWMPVDESVAAWRRARRNEVDVLRLPGVGHAPIGSREYEEALLGWLKARPSAHRRSA
jgi:uncharacterized protein